ncbi:hypothetical protein OAJ44_02005 [Chloroflexi bacterium]|nr:hypothetical protein [Chloroflexota bacterium]
MAKIRTISGTIDSNNIGWTLSHEHLVSGMGGMDRIGIYDEQVALRRCDDALKVAQQAQIKTIIDCTPVDLGRQVSAFEKLASSSPINIIAATGLYRWVPLSYYSWDPDTVAQFFQREIEDGIEGTNIHAGIIKIAWDIEYSSTVGGPNSLRSQLEKCARGAARAAKWSGVPITCHTRAVDKVGIRLLDIFEEEKLDLGAVTIGHTNDSTEIDYVLELARRGANVGLDRFTNNMNEEELIRRSEIALALIEAGYAEQTSLGHDSAAYSVNRGPASGGPRIEDANCWLPVPNFEIPWLLNKGVREDSIDAMMIKSIQRTFEAAESMKS